MSVIPMYRTDISEAAQIEIDRWREVADRHYGGVLKERAKRQLSNHLAFALGGMCGSAVTLLVLIWMI